MKRYLKPFLFCAFLWSSCQPDASPPGTPVAIEEPKPSLASKKEARRQADVLKKDTLNALKEEVVRKPSATAEADFKPFFKNFAKTIAQQDREAFNQFIDPDLALYILDAPGALPRFTRITNIATYARPHPGSPSFFTIRETFKDCSLKAIEALPKVTCEGKDMYAASGCFVAEATAFRKNEAYRHASLSPQEEKTVAHHQLLVQKTVLHTASGFQFHFGYVNGKWRVLFIDLMVPCSA